MSANRHLGRIIALQTLYEQDFHKELEGESGFSLNETMERNISRYHETVDDKKFITDLVNGINANLEKLDDVIRPAAPAWPIEQIARMDRVILRMGAYELLMAKDAPPKVVINEAVELAKAFGGDNSSKFINGVLGTLLRDKETEKPKPKSKKAVK